MTLLESVRRHWVVWVWRHTPTCAEMSRLASRALDEAPSLGTRLTMRLHFLICVWCERYVRHVKFLQRAAAGYDERIDEVPPYRLSEEAKRRMIERLRRP